MSVVTFSGGNAQGGGFHMGMWNSSFIFSLIAGPATGGASQVTFTSGSTVFVANGSFSNFDAMGRPQSGTITSFTYTLLGPGGVGTVTMSISGISISVSTLQSWALSGNVAAMDNALFNGADTMTGGEFGEAIYGYGGVDNISGGGGNDQLVGGLGNDILNGGDGDDWLDELGLGEGNDTLNGGEGNDLIRVVGADTADGGAGIDRVSVDLSSGGAVTLSTAGMNTQTGVTLSNGAVIRNFEFIWLQTGNGNDTLTMAPGGAIVAGFYGGGGTDTLIADASYSTTDENLVPSNSSLIGIFLGAALDSIEQYQITTGSGNDTLTGGALNDILNGGAGNDRINGKVGTNILNGGDGDDVITMEGGVNTINGGAGYDTLIIYGATSTISWSSLLAGSYNGSTFQSIEDFQLLLDTNQTLQMSGALTADGYVNGGILSADFSAQSGAVIIDFWTLQNNGHTIDLMSIQNLNVTGGSGNDDMLAGQFGSTLNGGAGNDVIRTYSGNDTINGGAGDDVLRLDWVTGWGVDHLDGGANTDTLELTIYYMDQGVTLTTATLQNGATLQGGSTVRGFERIGTSILTSGNDVVSITGAQLVGLYLDASLGTDTLTVDFSAQSSPVYYLYNSSYGVHTLNGTRIDRWESITIVAGSGADGFYGSAVNETFHGGLGADILNGGDGDDTLNGDAGADTLVGGAGVDALYGGDGNDELNGASGVDKMFGGAGDDIIYFDAADDLANVQGGEGYDLLLITGAAAPTTFNLALQGFEAAEVRYSDPGPTQPWNTRVLHYDTQWRLDREVTTNDDGTRVVLDFDEQSNQGWTTYWMAFDALNRADLEVLTYDDGSRVNLDYDQADAHAWTTLWSLYDASDNLLAEANDYDDGSRITLAHDTVDAFDWSENWVSYDALDQVDAEAIDYDDGSRITRDHDQDNSFNWATDWVSYDALDRVDVQVITYDDGTYAVQDFDQNDDYTWASQWWLYDANDNLIAFQGVNDDGSPFG